MRRRLAALALAFSLGMSAAAFAGQILEFRNGDLVPGKVVSISDLSIVFAPETGGELRVPWDRLWPVNRYDLWRSTLAEESVVTLRQQRIFGRVVAHRVKKSVSHVGLKADSGRAIGQF